MGGDELIVFEEGNYDTLIDKFVKKHRDLWESFVEDEYEQHCGDLIDNAEKER